MTREAAPAGASVLVVDDDPFVRRALAAVIEDAAGLRLAGTAENGAQGVEAAERLRPDLVLMDLEMPELTGLEATRRLCGRPDAPTVVMLTVRASDDAVVACLRAGAAGFLLKSAEAKDLIDAVRTVARGEGVVAPAVTRRLIAEFAAGPGGDRGTRPDPAVLDGLTPREREVLSLLGEGLSNAQIGTRLEMAEGTAKSHVSRLLGKLGLRSRVQAAVLARELGA